MTTETPIPGVSRRECGACYACCIHLGVEELHKFAGQVCVHLDGSRGPDKRCSIYASRPKACQTYVCGWHEGLLDENDRPDKLGIIVSFYKAADIDAPWRNEHTDHITATVHVTNAGRWKSKNLLKLDIFNRLFDQLIARLQITDIRIVNQATKQVIHLRDGFIRDGKLIAQQASEELVFESWDPPIGRFLTIDAKTNPMEVDNAK